MLQQDGVHIIEIYGFTCFLATAIARHEVSRFLFSIMRKTVSSKPVCDLHDLGQIIVAAIKSIRLGMDQSDRN